MKATWTRYITERQHLERVVLVGPYERGSDILKEMHDAGWRTVRSGPYTNKRMWPNVDPKRFQFVMEREVAGA